MANFNDKYTLSLLTMADTGLRAIQDINSLLKQLTNRLEARVDQHKLLLASTSAMRIVVAKHDSIIVGMGTICKVPHLTSRECEINDIVVDKNHRGKGIGGEILSRLLIEARNTYSAEYVTLTSRPEREEANKLYARHGFQLRQTNCYRLVLR